MLSRTRRGAGPRAVRLAGAVALVVTGWGTAAVAAPARADQECSGTSYTWTGYDGEDWADAQNWDPVGVPQAEDTATIVGSEEFQASVYVDSGTVCGLTVTGPQALVSATDLAVTGSLDWQGGSDPDAPSVIYGRLSAATGHFGGYVSHHSDDNVGAITVGSLVTDPGTVIALGDETSDLDVTTASLGSGTEISSNSSGEFGEYNADLNVAAGGRLTAVSDVNMPGMNLNLGAGAILVGGGHTINLGGSSQSVWGPKSTLANDGTTVRFTKWAKMVPQGFVLPAKDRLLLTQGELLAKGRTTARLLGAGQVLVPAGGEGFVDGPFVLGTSLVDSGWLTLDYDARLTTTGSARVTKTGSLFYNGNAHWKVLGPLRVDSTLTCGSECITLRASAKAKGKHAVRATFAAVSRATVKVKLTVSKVLAHKAKLHSRTIGTATKHLTGSGTYVLKAQIKHKLRKKLHKRGRIKIKVTLTQSLRGGVTFTSSHTVKMRVK